MDPDEDAGISPLHAALAEREAATVALVDEALAAERALLAYQPVMRADGERVAFHEGLIRIGDPSGRVIPARDFIAQVETTEIGRRIDCLALALALQDLADEPGLRLSVNMSARSIGFPPWTRVFEAGIAGRPDVAERLILEVTEHSAMVLPDLVRDFMAEVQDTGVSFALDDFGAGHTSFRYLRDFRFDIVKIDGRFVRGMAANPDDRALTAALVGVAQHFEMMTVGECVETEEDADACRALGVDCLQGYLYGAPSMRAAWRPVGRAAAG